MQKPGTYQTGLSDYADQERTAGDAALCAYGELYGRVQRKLFAEVAAGSSATSLTTTYVKRYGIPSRDVQCSAGVSGVGAPAVTAG